MVELFEVSSDEIKRIIPGTYEKVVKVTDAESGLVGFISVHNSAIGHAEGGLGISLGGLRMWPYSDEAAASGKSPETLALEDALRLSAGMTYKSAAADDGLGGGKAVIIADPAQYPAGSPQRVKLMHAMGQAIEMFAQRYPQSTYVTAEDVGTNVEDMKIIEQVTSHVSGTGHDAFNGNPSPFTAQGILAAMKEALGVKTMLHKRVAIGGLGNVGGRLAQLLIDEGAQLIVADKDAEKAEALKRRFPAHVLTVPASEIHKQPVDVYAPCAMGKCLDDETIPKIQAKYIIGAANNQLAEPRHGEMLYNLGKIYIPDFIANAGGVIAVGMEVKHKHEGKSLTLQEIGEVVERKIRTNTRRTIELSQGNNIPLSEAGMALANERLAAARQNKNWGEREEGRGANGKGWAHGS